MSNNKIKPSKKKEISLSPDIKEIIEPEPKVFLI